MTWKIAINIAIFASRLFRAGSFVRCYCALRDNLVFIFMSKRANCDFTAARGS